MAHDTTIGMIRAVLKMGVNLQEIYIDTVGPPEKYQAKLEGYFPGIKIVVAKKADSLYPIVSAASICAKCTRDDVLKNWAFIENNMTVSEKFGSGYPADPNTVNWMKDNSDPIFGYPRIIRFSWSTTQQALKKYCKDVVWYFMLIQARRSC